MPVEITEMHTRDPDVAHRTLNEVYAGEHPFVLSATRRRCDFSLWGARIGELHAGRFSSDLATRAVAPPFEEFMAGTLVSGRISWASGGDHARLSGGDVVRYSTTSAIDTSYDAYDIAVLRVPLADVARVAESHSGIRAADLRFHGLTALSPDLAQLWRALSVHVHDSLAHPVAGEALENPLVLAQLIDMVAGTALSVFPNTTMSVAHLSGPGWVAPAALRRAVGYIDAHAGEPITLPDIAAAAGTTGRAVRAAFTRHLGVPPTEHLRRVRLERAHRDLESADPASGVTVSEVAARWGFGNPDRFDGDYRSRFGVSPRRTLRT
jgi:AraC-like DNA-binding protein